MSDAKALRVFRKCDTDGGGEIDLNEFKMAMFAVDPVSGNTLGFSPSSLLSPQDAFELFDTDGTGRIDELEFADVLEYFGLDVSDEKQEALFRKYDKDASGFIDYTEFRAMWLRLANVREELAKRGIVAPKYATPWTLQQMLAKVLDEEEAREALVLAEAQQFLCKQREKERRVLLGRKAVVRAQDELAAALDAAGQVYVFGGGMHGQFSGEPIVRDEALFPGFAAVRELWSFRVNPTTSQAREMKSEKRASPQADKEAGKLSTLQQPVGGLDNELVQRKKVVRQLRESTPIPRDLSKFVRRRPENKRWQFQSPPRLNRRSVLARGKHHDSSDNERSNAESVPVADKDGGSGGGSAVQPIDSASTGDIVANAQPESNDDDDDALRTEELAKLFFEDRAFVRSLRFRLSRIMANTGLLWGRGVQHAAIAENVAFVVTGTGAVLTWGGKNSNVSSWEANVTATTLVVGVGDDKSDADGIDDSSPALNRNDQAAQALAKVTARSALQKMATPAQVRELASLLLAATTAEDEGRHGELTERRLRLACLFPSCED